MKHKLIKIAASLMIILIFSIFWLLKFIKYGASNCDTNGKSCDCFCCNSFGLRGYESCGNYGFIVGVGIGLVAMLIIYLFLKNINKSKK
jgi:hypothetical protein